MNPLQVVSNHQWFTIKSRKGKPGHVKSLQIYLRQDLKCGFIHCLQCNENNHHKIPSPCISPAASCILIPDAHTFFIYMDLFQNSLFSFEFMIICQSILQEIYEKASQKKIRAIYKFFESNSSASSHKIVYFPNIHHKECHVPTQYYLKDDVFCIESIAERNRKTLEKTVSWYQTHLNPSFPIHLLTSTEKIDQYSISSCSVSIIDYVGNYCPDLLPLQKQLLEQYEEMKNLEERTSNGFEHHYSSHQLQEELQKGLIHQGILKMNSNFPTEGYVKINEQKVLITSREDLNRSLHGDLVAIELLPKTKWKVSKSENHLIHRVEDDDETNKQSEEQNEIHVNNLMPCGRVVGILHRATHIYVSTVISSDEELNINKDEYVLAVPMNKCIPKIRIRVRNLDLFNQRLVVQIDTWPNDSFYPNGHYKDVLGPCGEYEVEIKALLIEHQVNEQPFMEASIQCLPSSCDLKNCFIIESNTFKREIKHQKSNLSSYIEEGNERKDLRHSHRIFSVDPEGCQDIDDAMSICVLSNGYLELGVHIADVSYFVPFNSSLDHEARNRATSVYLMDRRIDMLPPQLSADLCSLHSKVDRFALSILWQLDPSNFEIIQDKTWIGRTIIHSIASMTYHQAECLLNETDPNKNHQYPNESTPFAVAGEFLEKKIWKDLKKDIQMLTTIAQHFQRKREENGAIRLNSSHEVLFDLEKEKELSSYDNDKEKEDHPTNDFDIHETIAELMILANTNIANYLLKHFPSYTLLRRHLSPSMEKFQLLQQCIKSQHGEMIHVDSNKTLNQSLIQLKETHPNVMPLILNMLQRSMSEAEYIRSGRIKKENELNDGMGHYGLGLNVYTHFTSPIRRYADLMVHRLIIQSLNASIHHQKDINHPPYPPPPPHLLSLPLSSQTPSIFDFTQIHESLDPLKEIYLSNQSINFMEKKNFHKNKNKLPFHPKDYDLDHIVEICNEKHRLSKQISKKCHQLYLSLYLKDHPITTYGIIFNLKKNGFLIYIPILNIKGPVYIMDYQNNIQMNPKLLNIPEEQTQPASDGFSFLLSNRKLLSAKVTLNTTKDQLIISSSSSSKTIIFHLLDRVEVEIMCEFQSNCIRIPEPRFYFKQFIHTSKTKQNEKEKNSFSSFLSTSSLKNIQKDAIHHIKENKNTLPNDTSSSIYSYLYNKEWQYPSLNSKKKEEKDDIGLIMKVNKKGPGRFSFGGFQSLPSKTSQRFKYYQRDRSDSLEESMIIQRHESSSSSSIKEYQSSHYLYGGDNSLRTNKLHSQKRHARINRQNKNN